MTVRLSNALLFFIVLAIAVSSVILLLPAPESVFIVIFVPVLLFLGVRRFNAIVIMLAMFILFQNLLAANFGNFFSYSNSLKRLEDVVILALFIVTIFNAAVRGYKWMVPGIDRPLGLLIILALASSIKNHIVPYHIAVLDLFLLLKGFFIFYIVSNMSLDKNMLNKVTKTIFVIGVFVLLLGFVDLIDPYLVRGLLGNKGVIEYRFGIPSVQSIFTHPSVFGWFMAFLACFCFAFFITDNRRSYLIFAILFGVGTVLSMRAKPIMGLVFAVMAGLMMLSLNKKFRVAVFSAVVILIFVLIFGSQIELLFKEKIYYYMHAPGAQHTARSMLYRTSFEIAKDYYPFGAGLGTFGGWISAIYYSPLYVQYGLSSVYGLEEGGGYITDTFWPYLLAQYGIFGMITYIAIIFVFLRHLKRIYKGTNDPHLKAFSLGAIMALVEGVAESVAEPVFLSPPQFFYLFAMIGVCYSMAKSEAII